MPLNLPSGLGGGSLTVMIIDPDKHCIRTVGSFDSTTGSAKEKKKKKGANQYLGIQHSLALSRWKLVIEFVTPIRYYDRLTAPQVPL